MIARAESWLPAADSKAVRVLSAMGPGFARWLLNRELSQFFEVEIVDEVGGCVDLAQAIRRADVQGLILPWPENDQLPEICGRLFEEFPHLFFVCVKVGEDLQATLMTATLRRLMPATRPFSGAAAAIGCVASSFPRLTGASLLSTIRRCARPPQCGGGGGANAVRFWILDEQTREHLGPYEREMMAIHRADALARETGHSTSLWVGRERPEASTGYFAAGTRT